MTLKMLAQMIMMTEGEEIVQKMFLSEGRMLQTEVGHYRHYQVLQVKS